MVVTLGGSCPGGSSPYKNYKNKMCPKTNNNVPDFVCMSECVSVYAFVCWCECLCVCVCVFV